MDKPTPEEMKDAYSFGASCNNELSVGRLMNEKKFERNKAVAIVNALCMNKFAGPAKQVSLGAGVQDVRVKIRSAEVIGKLRQITDADEYLVYCAVEESDCLGIQSREVSRAVTVIAKNKLLTAAQITKALKSLEDRRLIKTVRSAQQKTKKLFMLAHLDPDKAIVGGSFYVNGEFARAKVDAYRSQIISFLSNTSRMTKSQLAESLKTGGNTDDLSGEDLGMLLRSLILDQEIVSTVGATADETVYTVSHWPDLEDYERIPCVSCPLQRECQREDLNYIDSILLRQTLTMAERKKLSFLRQRDSASGGSGSNLMFSNISSDVSIAHASSTSGGNTVVHPTDCPYFNQWLGLTTEPWPAKPLPPEEAQTPSPGSI